ncbi:phosphopantothenate synthase [Burkholderia ubonensis]|uniref:bifunctional phosphopantothenoylcysteine decarboxylase/phosphopantothenate--cysteine ligase CoaBC n=1 Tax=Burkholderia ubonensis TaxID=101571 RepID=UPI0007568BAC|nr:bifunctional phosphopantothenoylcysteine decarboxylase/phosphopantothenate--cysteine ligase CoaBC [Burkholderia ubonensis]KWN02790.1 phosphopantothenate synthase [Burkholderia ubonensis]KWN05431.1 phosphopantothenate synthase [Burkholderia ubonensis]KWN39596.1 phosphopantothenate synthase [Burkholderia ubonensis]ODQ30681.1 phosphopantothenate synthase [Burkholderia ubonensis]
MAHAELAGKHLVLGLTGGIACYKIAELTRLLTKAGATVQVAMTEAATQFITPVTMQALSGRPVYTSQWDPRVDNNMAHIDLSREADAIVIAPASTDFLAKLAHGFADDLLSTLCVARDCPLLVVPAMNRQMWQNPATQRNVAQLRADGVSVLGPDSGAQACGEVGDGRMLEPEAIYEAIVAHFQPKRLAHRRVLITAGPTFEPLDPVRGLTNRSSGKMGFALARAAQQAGAEVHLVAGPVALATPWGVYREDVQTAQQMYDAVMNAVPDADIFIAVAAVADWRVAHPAEHKMKKTADHKMPALTFVENPDILASVAALPDPPFCVGFAAESGDLDVHGDEKRKRKNVPLLVGNLGPQTFGRDDNEVALFDAAGITRLPRAPKDELAHVLVDEIAKRLPDNRLI